MSAAPPGEAIAIVICSRDRPDFLDGALAAIEDARRPDDEAVFVDSASTDARVREVSARYPSFTVVRCEEPGLARARNRGVQACRAPWLAFTDDDCRPEQDWADAVAAAVRTDARLGFVTGLVAPDRRGGPMISVGGGDRPRTFRYGDDPAEFGHGANFAVRREALDAIGGFDEALGVGARFPGAEDHDALWRILRAGWTGRYDPSVRVVHQQWRTRRQFLRSEYGYGLGSGAFAVKAFRLERRAGVRLFVDGVWRRGARSGLRSLSRGYETAAAGDFARFAGTVVGAAGARRLSLDGSRYSEGS